ncbi:MAG: WecB/TagA/CpsF family glycosyltransferase [Lachnospiraceae bacterium]|nr:WecB/TagA/CpsF family glycosyltransferase [Lachnospiraceae bacterium]
MNEIVEVLGIHIDHMNVASEMERISEFLSTDSLNTVGIITMKALLIAAEDPVQKEYLEQLDLGVVGELEVLEAAGVTSGQIYEETEEAEFLARFFWNLISNNHSFFLLGESEEEVEILETYVKETYPDILVRGRASDTPGQQLSAEWLVNEINGSGADVIISGLQSSAQAAFLLENRKMINGKIWLSLGEDTNIQNEAGIKHSWFGTLLKKNNFKRVAAKFRNEEIV